MWNVADWPELVAYQEEPKAMRVGTPGKEGYLRLVFEKDERLNEEGRTVLREWERRVPLIVQQALYFDEQLPGMACVYILASGGPNVDGDRFRQDITLRRGAMVYLSTGAATKLAEMQYNHSALTQHIRLEEDAYLEYLPEPVIPCRHTRFASATCLQVAPSATVCYAEIYTPGRRFYQREDGVGRPEDEGARKGECFEYDVLAVGIRGERPDGKLLFTERWVVEPHQHHPRQTGIMGRQYEVLGSVVVMTPKEHAEAIYASTPAFIDDSRGLAAGPSRLPNEAGIIYKVLGKDTMTVKRLVREFASTVRKTVKGKPIPEEFPWR
jgi:urease accessory protein